MASAGVDFKCFADEPEYHSVGVVDSNAPPSRTIAFEWLWLANAAIAVAPSCQSFFMQRISGGGLRYDAAWLWA